MTPDPVEHLLSSGGRHTPRHVAKLTCLFRKQEGREPDLRRSKSEIKVRKMQIRVFPANLWQTSPSPFKCGRSDSSEVRKG